MMRIITGSARGTHLETLEGENTRPTSERFKEALFSMLQFDIEGRRVLDLFGGSGQLGLEALSRGAATAVFIDNVRDAADIIIATSEVADAADNGQSGFAEGMAYLAAAVVTSLSGIGGGIAVAAGAPAAIGATSEDPKAFGKALIFVALGEGIALYGLLVSILILSKV